MKALTKERFIEKAFSIHGDKYDYSKVEYVGSKNYINIVCEKHGMFTVRASHHLENQGCKLCSYEKFSKLYTFTNKVFVEKCKVIHGDLYDYSNTDYKGTRQKVKVTCSKHGDFQLLASKHLDGQGCQECTYNRTVLLGSEVVPIGAKAIPLTQGKYAIVDEEDYEKVIKHDWSFDANGYAISSSVGKMHRFILEVIDPKLLGDHINMDKIDNRKCNLRVATSGQNNFNKKSIGGRSKYKGVTKCGAKWRARIALDRYRKHIGVFDTEEQAAMAYDELAAHLYKEFAYLNFPKQEGHND